MCEVLPLPSHLILDDIMSNKISSKTSIKTVKSRKISKRISRKTSNKPVKSEREVKKKATKFDSSILQHEDTSDMKNDDIMSKHDKIEDKIELVELKPIIQPISTNGYPKILSDMDGFVEIETLGWNLTKKNMFRRILLSKIQTVSIDLIEIYENQCVMPDECVGLRLALLPIRIEQKVLETLNPWNQCECEKEGCKKCCLKGKIKLYNETKYVQKVTSDDLIMPKGCKIITKHPTLLIFLHPGKRLHIEFNIQKGCGSDHSKWIPTGSISTHIPNKITFVNNLQWTTEQLIEKTMLIMKEQEM
jgi:hypothetical protein